MKKDSKGKGDWLKSTKGESIECIMPDEPEIFKPDAKPVVETPMEQIHKAKSVFMDRLHNLLKVFELQTGCYIEDIGLEHDMHMGEYKSTSIVEVTVGLPKEPFFTTERGDME